MAAPAAAFTQPSTIVSRASIVKLQALPSHDFKTPETANAFGRRDALTQIIAGSVATLATHVLPAQALVSLNHRK